ncbi:MAG: SGNH/GDSL hydrolase family protein [Deltaproteobacteria bacterium]|nr:SGNH/GDSL hydrolase family protein [Deltaproteobacteria bacterium]
MLRQLYQYDPVIGFRFVPNLKARVPHEGGGYLVRTNAQGFRADAAFKRERTPGKRRVLLFGDSFTAGEGVSNGQRTSDWLERLVPDLEVYNFGLPATGTDQHWLIARELAAGIEHDFVMIGVFVENIRRVASRYRWFQDDAGRRVLYAKPWFELDANGQPALHGVPVPKRPLSEAQLAPGERAQIAAVARFPKLKRAFSAARAHPLFERVVVESGLKESLQRVTRYQPLAEYDDANGAAWRTMRAVLVAWAKQCASRAAIVPIPLHQYAYGISSASAVSARLSEAAAAGGADYWDPLPQLSERCRGDRSLYFPNDGHLTNAGHRALAEILAPLVEKRLTEPGARR